MYRDDHAAAIARVEALEQELAALEKKSATWRAGYRRQWMYGWLIALVVLTGCAGAFMWVRYQFGDRAREDMALDMADLRDELAQCKAHLTPAPAR